MRCPHCKALQPASKVTKEEASRVRRLYTCVECGTGWASVEVLHGDTVKVPGDWREAAKRLRRVGLSFRAIGARLGKCHQTIAYTVSLKARNSYQEREGRYRNSPGMREALLIKERFRREKQAEAQA